MPLDSLVAPLAAFLAPTSPLPPPPVQFHGEGVVHTTIYAGVRRMRDDFEPADEPWTLGIALDIREPGRQESLEFGYFYSEADDDTRVGTNTLDVDNTVHELWAGGRWAFDPWGGSLQPYLGIGGSVLYAKFKSSGIGGEDSNSGWAVGLYGHGGLDWKFADGWSVGLDLRALVTTQAKLQREVPLDSLQAALTLTWAW
jgi:opacity protein-like surface antigen